MINIKIISIGKTKETWLSTAIEEYKKRLNGRCKVQFILLKDTTKLISTVKKEPSVICLDPKGSSLSSEEFSTFFFSHLEKNGASLSFVIGGAEGLPVELRKGYPLISFSKLTFTHQITRLILVEQLYRAIEIEKGSNYHK